MKYFYLSYAIFTLALPILVTAHPKFSFPPFTSQPKFSFPLPLIQILSEKTHNSLPIFQSQDSNSCKSPCGVLSLERPEKHKHLRRL